MEIKLKTLTPLWTGGVGGTCDRIHETGIIGSLRWWYEVLVRGLGGQACDPTEDGKCEYDPKEGKESVCGVCYLFGTTGWARRFRLAVAGKVQPGGPQGTRHPTGPRFKADGKTRPSWYFNKGPGKQGNLTLVVQPLDRSVNLLLVLGVLKFIEKQAGLAAKAQLGYGWIEITEPIEFDAEQFIQVLQERVGTQPIKSNDLPAFDKMFWAEIETNDHGITGTLNLRYDVRAACRTAFGGNADLRHFISGFVQGQGREASKIHSSETVNGVMRVWAWIPDQLPDNSNRGDVLEEIHKVISAYGKILSWRELNSKRDTLTPFQSDKLAFLTSLFQGAQR